MGRARRAARHPGNGSVALTATHPRKEFATPVTSPPLPVPRPGSRGRLFPRSRPHLFQIEKSRISIWVFAAPQYGSTRNGTRNPRLEAWKIRGIWSRFVFVPTSRLHSEILVPAQLRSQSRIAAVKQKVSSSGPGSIGAAVSLVVDRRQARTVARHNNGITGKELCRLERASRFMELHCSPHRDVCLWVAHLSKGAGRAESSDVWKRVTRQQQQQSIFAYSALVFEPDDTGLHAHIIYIGDTRIEAHLRRSKAFASMFDAPDAIERVYDLRGLTQGYFAKMRTSNAGYGRTDLGGRISGAHTLPGGGDRVRLSRELERDAIEAGYVKDWPHTYARRAETRKAYRPRRLTRRALKPAGQLPLIRLPQPSRLQDFGRGKVPPAVALEIEHLRNRHGLSQRELAARIGISQGQYANARRGHDPLSAFAVNRLRETLAVNSETPTDDANC